MKKIHLMTWMLVIISVIYSRSQETQMTLMKAIQDSIVSVSIEGAGGNLGDCMDFSIFNRRNTAVNINVGSGLKLVSKDSFYQNMYITKTLDFRLEPKAKRKFRIYAMCCQVHKSSPRKGKFFKVGRYATGTVLRLIKLIDNKNQQNYVGQKALWVVTDNGIRESLIRNNYKNDDDMKTVALLREAGAEGFVPRPVPKIQPKGTFKIASLNKIASAAYNPAKIKTASGPTRQTENILNCWDICLKLESAMTHPLALFY